jgi:hypothetical protein
VSLIGRAVLIGLVAIIAAVVILTRTRPSEPAGAKRPAASAALSGVDAGPARPPPARLQPSPDAASGEGMERVPRVLARLRPSAPRPVGTRLVVPATPAEGMIRANPLTARRPSRRVTQKTQARAELLLRTARGHLRVQQYPAAYTYARSSYQMVPTRAALEVVARASCLGRKRSVARWAFQRLGPAGRQVQRALCRGAGIDLP